MTPHQNSNFLLSSGTYHRANRLSISKIYRRFSSLRITLLPVGNITHHHHLHLKTSSPQRLWEVMQIIHAIFDGSVIREGSGKLHALSAVMYCRIYAFAPALPVVTITRRCRPGVVNIYWE
jgi:hypothetical protein